MISLNLLLHRTSSRRSKLQAFVCAALLLCCLGLYAETLTGKVTQVADGDTLTIVSENTQAIKIRLAGIDAPEKAQAFGQRSKEHLEALVNQKQVTVESNKKDKYGRNVGQVLLNGQDVNLEQLRAGMAWFYRQYERELTPELRERYVKAEDEAKAGRIGLWVDPKAAPPWQWRHPDRLDK